MKSRKKLHAVLSTILIVLIVLPIRPNRDVSAVFNDINFQFEIEKSVFDIYTLRNCFRNASLVVEAECIDSRSSGGRPCSSFKICTVFAGDANENDEISVFGKYSVGDKCIFYLSIENNNSFNYKIVYSPVENGIMKINGSTVRLNDGRDVPLSSVKSEIYSMKEELFVPNEYKFYSKIEDLLSGCNEYFVGRIDNVSAYLPTVCRSGERGELVRSERKSLQIDVTVLNAFGGGLRSGEKVSIRQVDNMCQNVINASTLTAVRGSANSLRLPSNGDVCLFFVIKSPDDKVDFFFPVNPYQGYVKVDGSGQLISCSNMNTVINDYESLFAFFERIPRHGFVMGISW